MLSPPLPLVPVADTVGGERAISAALALLLARGQHDSGGHQRITLDAAAYDSAAALRHGLFGNGAPLGGALPSYNIYATADGHIALGALEPHFEARTREVLDCDGTSAAYTRAFAAHTTAHWEDLAARHDIPLTAVRDALVKNNTQSRWVPDFVGERRFHNWLEGARLLCCPRFGKYCYVNQKFGCFFFCKFWVFIC